MCILVLTPASGVESKSTGAQFVNVSESLKNFPVWVNIQLDASQNMPLHPGKVQNDWIPKAPDPSQAAAEQPRQELTCSCRSLAISSRSLCSSSSLCSASIRALSISFSLIRCSYSCHSWALRSVANWKGSTTAEESKVFSEGAQNYDGESTEMESGATEDCFSIINKAGAAFRTHEQGSYTVLHS